MRAHTPQLKRCKGQAAFLRAHWVILTPYLTPRGLEELTKMQGETAAHRICFPVAWRRLLLCSARENWFPGCAKWFFLWRVAPPAKGDSDLPPVSRPTGFVSGTHFVWYLSRGTYRRRVSLPWRLLATTPGINRRPGAGGGISCAEGDSGPPRDGSEPSWARPCEASGTVR